MDWGSLLIEPVLGFARDYWISVLLFYVLIYFRRSSHCKYGDEFDLKVLFTTCTYGFEGLFIEPIPWF